MLRICHATAAAILVLSSMAPDATAATQDRPADAVAVEDVVARYVEAREARDAARHAALFTEDADQLVSNGEWRRGREAVVSGGLASSARSSGARTIEVEAVRFPAADVAIADGRYEIAAAGGAPARRMWTTFVMVRQAGTWRISAIRNMRPTE
jgi:uncharacterized protein (TIGR02246 family)